MSSITVLLVIVAAASLLPTEVRAQNNGDIRLVNHWKNFFSEYNGRLEIFINGQWGTFCGNSGTDLQAVADTACRQLGSIEALGSGTVTKLGFPVAPEGTPVHFGSIDCGSSASDDTCSSN